jgi:hypothetical protein
MANLAAERLRSVFGKRLGQREAGFWTFDRPYGLPPLNVAITSRTQDGSTVARVFDPLPADEANEQIVLRTPNDITVLVGVLKRHLDKSG